jgi:transposase
VIEMSQVLECKQLHGRGVPIREISRRTGVARNTVRRYLRGDGQPGVYKMSGPRSQPARDAIRERVVSILVEEARSHAPKKQRLTAARVQRLLGKDGESVSLRTVQELVREVRLEQRDPLKHAYLPLAYEPGEDAQVDFFEAVVDDEKDGRVKVFILLVRACFSGRCHAYVAPNQTREALLEGLMQALEFFGGVFLNLWFDNLTPAVRKVLRGRDRSKQRAFEAFEAHYGFKAQFCSPGKGNEKGGVEGEVRYARHEVLTPIPTVSGRPGVQALFDGWMERDVTRTIRASGQTIGERWEEEIPALLALPAARFEVASSQPAKVSNRSWIQTGTNFYSVPVEWVGREVTVRVDAERIRVSGPGERVVEHRRLYGRHEMLLELEHYLPLLERKHRGVDRAVPVRQFIEKETPCWKALLAELRRTLGEVNGGQDFVAVLQLCSKYGVDRVQEAIARALREEFVSVETVRYFLWKEIENQWPVPDAMEYPGPQVEQASVAAYACLHGVGEVVHV